MSSPLQIAIATYPGFTALDAMAPYEVLKLLPDVEVQFVAHEPGPITTDRGVLVAVRLFDLCPSFKALS